MHRSRSQFIPCSRARSSRLKNFQATVTRQELAAVPTDLKGFLDTTRANRSADADATSPEDRSTINKDAASSANSLRRQVFRLDSQNAFAQYYPFEAMDSTLYTIPRYGMTAVLGLTQRISATSKMASRGVRCIEYYSSQNVSHSADKGFTGSVKNPCSPRFAVSHRKHVRPNIVQTSAS